MLFAVRSNIQQGLKERLEIRGRRLYLLTKPDQQQFSLPSISGASLVCKQQISLHFRNADENRERLLAPPLP
jgi:hypothetical protein